MILRSDDVIISMDWLDSHDVIINSKVKWLSWTDDEGRRRVIVGRKQGVSMSFILPYSYRRACIGK
jgi:hypothetical protein